MIEAPGLARGFHLAGGALLVGAVSILFFIVVFWSQVSAHPHGI
jgi:hypothetical protein